MINGPELWLRMVPEEGLHMPYLSKHLRRLLITVDKSSASLKWSETPRKQIAIKKMNLNKGLHRIFAIACGIWFFYCLVIIPYQSVQSQKDSIIRLNTLEIKSCSSVKIGHEECLKKADSDFHRLFEEAGIGNFYAEIAKEDGLLLIVLLVIGVPIFVYVITRVFISTTRWVIAGFKE